jgi:hypothetical protein
MLMVHGEIDYSQMIDTEVCIYICACLWAGSLPHLGLPFFLHKAQNLIVDSK